MKDRFFDSSVSRTLPAEGPRPNKERRTFLKALVTGLVSIAWVHGVAAQPAKYPAHPIKIIVPFAAGGGVDAFARLLGKQIEEKRGVTVVIENRAGANGTVGANGVLQSQPDGYTLLFSAATHVMARHVMSKVSFDPVYVVRVDAPVTGKVGIISGGGSGHEPLHGGFVGQGMLDAACPGQVFTSPSPDQMEAATSAVNGGAGVLHIVKNYTGDVMNFEMAAELCQARGIEVQSVVINDDVAVQDSLYTAGRRGVGATVLAEKICGAAAARGYDLARVAALARRVNACARSMGMALSPCTVPAAGKPNFVLGDDEIEMGVGIHGEPGRRRMAPYATCRRCRRTCRYSCSDRSECTCGRCRTRRDARRT